MTHAAELEQIALQEKTLRFTCFNAQTAWSIGTAIKDKAEERNVFVVIDIQLHGQPLFFYAMPGSTPNNHDWVRRKRNVVNFFHRSSYAIGLKLAEEKSTFAEKYGKDPADFATHGGSFPIFLEGTGCVGSITVSGLPQREDHELIVSVISEYLDSRKDRRSSPVSASR